MLLSPEIIAVNQDPLGVPADLVWKQGPLEVYAAPLGGGSRVAVLFNRLNIDSQYPTTNITLLWAQLGIQPSTQCAVRCATFHCMCALSPRCMTCTGSCFVGVMWVALQ